ncbi:hypothetical protein [Methylomagnum ishizawai]|nr:hypothetical protein [Methylomagnum ishizawai]
MTVRKPGSTIVVRKVSKLILVKKGQMIQAGGRTLSAAEQFYSLAA